jgi:hypothetical protein
MTRADIFMTASWVGLSGLGVTITGIVASGPTAVHVAGMFVAIFAAILLFCARKADEYTLGLWNAGASVAFGAMVLAYLGIPFAEGMYDGFTDNEQSRDLSADLIPAFAIFAFYFGLFWKRLLGDM